MAPASTSTAARTSTTAFGCRLRRCRPWSVTIAVTRPGDDPRPDAGAHEPPPWCSPVPGRAASAAPGSGGPTKSRRPLPTWLTACFRGLETGRLLEGAEDVLESHRQLRRDLFL